MNAPYQAITAGLLWAVALWRLPSATNSRKQRTLWGAFAALAAAMTFEVPSVAHLVDHGTGVNSLANLAKHLLGVASASAVLEFVISVVRPGGFLPGRMRHCMTITTVTAMVTLFAVSPRPRESANFFEDYDGSAFPALYMAVFVLYIGMAMSVATWLFLGKSRLAPKGWLRSGLRLLGSGTAVGIAYAVQRAVFLALLALGHNQAGTKDVETDLSNALKTAAILLILLGSSLPPISVLVQSLRDWRSLRFLAPLWSGLTTAVPHVILATGIPRRRLGLRLHRRIIEIGDASLTLREYVPASFQDQAYEQAAAAGLTGELLDATAEACWLATAARRAQAGHAPLSGLGHPSPGGVDLDADSEFRWLSLVNAAYHRSPLVHRFAETHASSTPEQLGSTA